MTATALTQKASLLRRTAATVLAALTLSATVSCSTDDEEDTATSTQGGIHTTDPLGHAVDLEHEPTAAMGFYTTDVDILATLGIPLASTQPVRDGYDSFPSYFPQDALKNVTDTFVNYPEVNYEAVADAAPDFILNGIGGLEEAHDKLSAVASTYSNNSFDGEPWLRHFERTAADLGREEHLTQWKDRYTAATEDFRAKIESSGHGELTVGTLGFYDNKFNVGCYAGLECGVFSDLGLDLMVEEGDRDLELSMEQIHRLADLDAVWIGTVQGKTDDADFENMMDQLKDNPQWRSLPFVKNNRVFTYDMEMQYGSPSAALAFADRVSQDLTD
ncbi:Putative ABC-type Fe3+-hydroxamate transporter, substrate-binding lipoprotein [Corynebacterium glyciniphilum AJ 3170]|uniref:Putative ABC-type Fe3+-hydroxamate transporter, substrate-binding lipoprotein n=1 Tax=Corynebacterium glyciniphilum AJ 3170 TaxID=1404245 RepID=X5DKB2_9CORY|nr:ABC transporter substrate-binding protein [Corynebacterium glyciniphilum]AHW63548.1 Putative ABC-type Fe3+-hydroxamate transporter, substrate-binding lipoprotein [Corynebacterium glyciniphilum AJ 3170]